MAIFFLFAQKGPTICCRLPDEASFLEIGGGVSPPPPYPPGSFGPAHKTKKTTTTLVKLFIMFEQTSLQEICLYLVSRRMHGLFFNRECRMKFQGIVALFISEPVSVTNGADCNKVLVLKFFFKLSIISEDVHQSESRI